MARILSRVDTRCQRCNQRIIIRAYYRMTKEDREHFKTQYVCSDCEPR